MQNILAAVSVVHVKIHQCHPLHAVHIERVTHADHYVIEEAKTIGRSALRMMARRAHIAEGYRRFAADDQIGRQHCCSGGAQCRLICVRIHAGIRIDPVKPAFRHMRRQLVNIERRMCLRQLMLGRQRRLIRHHVIEQALDQQMVADCTYAFRAFGILIAHVMFDAIWVGNISRQQACLLSGDSIFCFFYCRDCI